MTVPNIIRKLDNAAKIEEECGTKYAAMYMQEAIGEIYSLHSALTDILSKYTALANSGDCGFWDPEQEPEVIKARKVLK